MRFKPWYTLILIVILTLIAGWVDLPAQTLNPFGIKDGVSIHKGLDLQGGLQVVLQAKPPKGQTLTSGTLQGERDTIERRVNGLGVSEPLIQTRGNDQIIVELPGVKDPQNAVKVLQQTALLEIIDTQGQALPVGTVVNTTAGSAADFESGKATPTANGTPGATPNATPGATPEASPVAGATGSTTNPNDQNNPAANGPVYQTIVTGADLKDAYPSTDQFGSVVVGFELKSDAANKFYQYTSTHVGQPMSIVVDKHVINTATIQSAIQNTGQISGLTVQEVNDLSVQLKAGALSVPLDVIQSRTVGPTLGQDSIDRSITAGLAGLAIVGLFMILFYRVPGVLSVIALMIYTGIAFALFKSIPVVLTLAGIAGFILSIGMAVDANVLIFARLKEELRKGHTVHRAVEAGFDHAWPSIRDSNFSTMITCVILYWFGRYTGASIITGFALTLGIGVAVSLFTAITVTRTLLRVMLNSGWFHNEWWFGVEKHEIPTTAPAAGD
ncbi:MAG TPA: protein translocase subunit SecD [Nitrolancea sp.]|nr:protein translocase subunit SecD [Nitrolancea sp.]